MSNLNDLSCCDNVLELHRQAIAAIRTYLGIERVSVFLADPKSSRVLMRGTWGTDEKGESSDEHHMAHECWPDDLVSLKTLNTRGDLFQFCENMPLSVVCRGKRHVIATGWLAVTPMLLKGELVGIIYNDTALSRSAIDPVKQAHLAIFGRHLARLTRQISERYPLGSRARASRDFSSALTPICATLKSEPWLSSAEVARRFALSPRQLARSFRVEMGQSLVDYRNEIRLSRFFALKRRGGHNLLQAALEAGFGSYAQFHRVHRTMTGQFPKAGIGLEIR